ncbi:MAG: periplasmic heavy metal sensor [Pseudomonadota bacterium]
MADQSGQAATVNGKRPSRLWRVVLVISLALNLAVVGIVVGTAASGRFGDGPPRTFDFGPGPILRALTGDERRSMMRSMRADRAFQSFRPEERFAVLVSALQADPFDKDAFAAAMAMQAERNLALQEQAQVAFVDVISDMTPERRAAFALALEQELAKPRRPGPARAPSGG